MEETTKRPVMSLFILLEKNLIGFAAVDNISVTA